MKSGRNSVSDGLSLIIVERPVKKTRYPLNLDPMSPNKTKKLGTYCRKHTKPLRSRISIKIRVPKKSM